MLFKQQNRRRFKEIFIFCLILLFFIHCFKKQEDGVDLGILLALSANKGGENSDNKRKEALITAFEIEKTKGVISNQDIKVTAIHVADAKNLTATVTLSKGATINPEPTKSTDYTNPVSFTVTAEDGTTKKNYKVTVTIEKPILSWTAGWRNENKFSANINGDKINIDVDSANFETKVTLNTGVSITPDPKTVTDWTKEVSFTTTKRDKSETYKVKVTVNEKDIIKVKNKEIKNKIESEIKKLGNTGSFNHIDVSEITNMEGLFKQKESFNGNISKWNTSKVENMNQMFFFATAFNQNINNWNTSKVESMNRMFFFAATFNQNISNWNTSKVENMNQMFLFATAFNQNISNWDLSKVTNCGSFSTGATAFQNANKPTFRNCRE